MSEHIAPRSRARIFMNWLAGALIALLVVGGFSAPAMAAPGTLTIEKIQSSANHEGLPVLVEGATYEIKFGYGQMADGETVTVTLPAGISIPPEALIVPPENSVVKSFALNASGQLVVTFLDDAPTGIDQGSFTMKFKLDTVTNAEVSELEWALDGVPTTTKVIVTEKGNEPQNTDTWSEKLVGNVSITHTIVDGKVVFADDVVNTKLPYTVRVSSKDARSITLSDTLGANLEFVAESLNGTKTVRDKNGMNPVNADVEGLPAIAGTTFTHSFEAEANSFYTFTYEAKIAGEAGLEAIRAELQAAYDAVDKVDGGDYAVKLVNKVSVSGQEHRAEAKIEGKVKGEERPGTDKAFTKSVDPGRVDLKKQLAAGSKLDTPIDLTYTLTADLTAFASFTDSKFALKRNVVVKDYLYDPVEWKAGAQIPLEVTDQHGIKVVLTEATDLEDGKLEEQIAANKYVNHYVFDGTNFYLNIGKDVTKTYTITAKATLAKLPKESSGNTLYQWEYRADNGAEFIYADGKSERKGATTFITTEKDLSGGVDDENKFSKRATGGTITARPGTSVQVPYEFKVAAGLGNAATSRIIDEVDHETFNVTAGTLADIAKTISGTYGSGLALNGSMFDLSLDAENQLVIAPNAAFKQLVNGEGDLEAPLTEAWNISFSLPTHVLQGKQTLDVKNSARYEGSDLEYTFTSSSTTKATSYGNEMELRKQVYAGKDADGNAKFTTNLRAEVDEKTGKLIKDEFTYRVELMPHGTFTGMVRDVVDVLPAELEFLGFVNPDQVGSDDYQKDSTYRIPGANLEVNYDAKSNTLTVPKGDLEPGKTVSLFFKVKLAKYDENIGVTNIIGTAGATITPTNDYPLSLLKRDSADAAKLITDSGARFSVLKDDKQTVVLEDLRVKDGKIVTANGGTPVVKNPGTYWLREDTAPSGYKKSDELLEIGFKADDSAKEVVLFNDRQNYAIGDYTWIDANRDGIQDAGEDVLPGVKVELIRDGKVVAETTSDENGRYMFDELPSGEYQVKFTLTEDQQKIYTFTTQTAGKDGAVDSNADRKTGLSAKFMLDGTNKNLTTSYDFGKVKATDGIDPTWDAGVVLKTYAIGDYTWIDANRDGIQDADEEILSGVTVELLQGGVVVATTTTDAKGHYLFDNLAAGEYEVKFTLTEDQQKVYRFTEQGAGKDGAADSDADPKTGLTTKIVLGDDNKNLTLDYADGTVEATEGIDPTWDAGVIKKSWAIGDYTWIDANRDGIQDADEEILAGVTVELLQDGKVVSTTVTDEQGRYMFDELAAGEYQVKFTLTDAQKKIYTFTKQGAGDSDAADSNADRETGLTTTIVLGDENKNVTKDYPFGEFKASEGIDPTWDAGVVLKSYAIGDYTWIDANRDGIQDADEEILEGVTVELLQDGVVVATTVTDSEGRYMFDDLLAGEYEVKFTLTDAQQKIYTFTKQGAGDSDAADSNAERGTGLTGKIVLGDDNPNLTQEYRFGDFAATEGIDPTWDAGVVLKSYAIGDVVWIDTNKDGIQDSAEKVLPGVTVELFQDGKVIATTTTDKNGRYIFDELLAGEYEVKFTLTPEQQKVYGFTKQHAGDSDAVDSNADPKTGLTVKIVLNDENANLTFDYENGTFRATQGIDPTWDAGVIVLDIPVAEVPKAENPGTPGVNELPSTGGSLPLTIGGAALALLAAGAALMMWRRRTA